MKAVIAVNKPISLTPNQVIEKIRLRFPHLKSEKIGFAGRLDPMARGVLLLLVGDENKGREKFLNLNKTYQFTAILGLETDSYDLLGLLKSDNFQNPLENYQPIVDSFIKDSIGTHHQLYPPFSTKPVQGKQLFKWAKEGKINEIEIPTKEINIYNFSQISESRISAQDLQNLINERITKIEGFFRQDETLKTWENFFQKTSAKEFTTLSFEVSCSSGTYVRSLVHNLGQKLGYGAVTLEIYRTKVGNYSIKDSIELGEPGDQK